MKLKWLRWRASLAALAFLAGSGGLLADTLVLRNGRRLRGELIRVDGKRVEFQERYGRRARFDRDEVERIELGRDRDDDRDRGDWAGAQRPGGMRERVVGVSARRAWNETGVELRRGQVVYFEVSGKVRWGKDRQDDADGEGGDHHNPNRPMPNHAGAALIGRVGDDAPFLIGKESGPIRMRSSGPLYLGINDDYLADNSGSFRVVVYY